MGGQLQTPPSSQHSPALPSTCLCLQQGVKGDPFPVESGTSQVPQGVEGLGPSTEPRGVFR